MKNSHSIIDFIVIGAARSGTTSLFSYLRKHPDIYLPLEKEVCFFSDNDRYEKGLQWYLDEYFTSTKAKEKILGEATPAYMLFNYVPKRIHDLIPGTKLVAILRNPIYRAYSHYLFAKRLGIEDRDFDDAIYYLIQRGTITDEKIGSQNKEYIMFGEYGRILKNYYSYFENDQIKIIFFEDLKNNPSLVMKDLFLYLGVDENFVSEEFTKRHNVAGKPKFKSVASFQHYIKSHNNIKAALQKLFPVSILGAIDMWITTKGNLKATSYNVPNHNMITTLKDYYTYDVSQLKDLCNLEPPWEEFR